MAPLRDWFSAKTKPGSVESTTTTSQVRSESDDSDAVGSLVEQGIRDLEQALTEGVRRLPGPLDLFEKVPPGQVLGSAILETLLYFAAGRSFSEREVTVSYSVSCLAFTTRTVGSRR